MGHQDGNTPGFCGIKQLGVFVRSLRWFPLNIRAIMAKIKLPEKPGGML